MAKRFYIINAVYWLVLSLYLSLKEVTALGWSLALMQFTIFFVVGLIVTSAYHVLFKRRQLNTKNLTLLVTTALPWLALVALVVMVYDFILDQKHYGVGFDNDPAYAWTLSSYFLDGFIIASPWFLFYHCYQYGRYAADLEKAQAMQQIELNKAQIENLVQKLNPHFLFNTLNTIRWLTSTDPLKARRAIDDLAEILRYATRGSSETLVPLGGELEITARYLAMEKLRFEDLDYRIDSGEASTSHKVPLFSIVNLVENAITHGISQAPEKRKLHIRVDQSQTSLIIRVVNNGKAEKITKGFGLLSIEKMLKQSFGNQASLVVESAKDEVTSIITVPRHAV
jgi:hypothetical protein